MVSQSRRVRLPYRQGIGSLTKDGGMQMRINFSTKGGEGGNTGGGGTGGSGGTSGGASGGN